MGLNGLPCGVPSVRRLTKPPSIIPACRYRLISFSRGLSVIRSQRMDISLSWFTRSKNFSKSISTTLRLPFSKYSSARSTAWWAERPGRKPKLLSLKLPSYSRFSFWAIACCIRRSVTVGMPSIRFPPLGFGISTLRTAQGIYVPHCICDLMADQFFHKWSWSSSTPIPSMPAAPLLETTCL